MSPEPEAPRKDAALASRLAWAERALAFLLGCSKLFVVGLVAAFAIASFSDLRSLIPRISRFKALGLEIEVSQLEDALRRQAESVKAPNVALQPGDIEAVLQRALKVQPVFERAKILWLDDEPANNLPFRQLLRTLGAGVEPARTTKEALALAAVDRFDLIVTDITRPGEDGVNGLAQLRAVGASCPAVFYVLQVDPARPTPPGALGITNRPDALLHLVIDGLERARWSTAESAAEQPVEAAGALRRR